MSFSTIIGHGAMHGLAHAFGTVGTAVSQVVNELGPIELPQIGELIRLHIRDWIDDATLNTAAAKQGVSINIGATTLPAPSGLDYSEYARLWNTLYAAECEIPNPLEMREIANRQFLSDGRLDRMLVRHGYKSDVYRAWIGNLRYDIPGPSDLVRFSVRHVWEPDLLENIGYDQEFPGAIIDVWHAMKGLDYPLFSGPFARQIGVATGNPDAAAELVAQYTAHSIAEPTWARAYWWSHWVLPSPGQGYEMLFRLRRDRDPSFDPPEALGQTFDWDDLRLLLRANDYPPKYRPLLAAIAYRMPGVRFIRDFVKQDVYSKEDLLEWAKRWGYSPRDALDITEDVWRNVKGATAKKAACKGCAACEQAFEIGVLSEYQLTQCFVGYGASEADAARDTQLARLRLKTRRAREIVANVRKRFLRGTLSVDQARNLLTQYGLAAARVADYLDDWQLEFEAGRKEISASQAVRYACEGLIAIPELVNRLTNLGYPEADQAAMVGQALYCAANLAAATEKKLERAQRTSANELYTAARRQRQIVIETQRLLAAHGSPNTLKKWFCEGVIGECEVYTRLNALSWPDVDITRFLSDCKSGRKPTGTCPPGTPTQPPIV